MGYGDKHEWSCLSVQTCLMFFICMRAYKCTVHECMYVLCTRFHFLIMQVYCMCVIYGVQAVYITMYRHRCVHSCTCTLRENSVKMRSQLMSLQVIRACKWYEPASVCARVVCVCVSVNFATKVCGVCVCVWTLPTKVTGLRWIKRCVCVCVVCVCVNFANQANRLIFHDG